MAVRKVSVRLSLTVSSKDDKHPLDALILVLLSGNKEGIVSYMADNISFCSYEINEIAPLDPRSLRKS
jgi:hypothetical protein